jgi:hypothetical protein
MTSSERYPGGALRKAWPLAVSLAAHVLLVLAWIYFGARERIPDDPPRALSVLLLPVPAHTSPPDLAPVHERPSEPDRPPERATVARQASPAAPSQPAQPTPGLSVPAPAATTAPSAWDILNAAKQDIRKSGGEARPGKGEALRQGDGKWSRFEERLAGAHVDPSPVPVTESYTSPDGQAYYRTRAGKSVACRKTGSTGPPAPWRSESGFGSTAAQAATLGVANSAGGTLCPEGKRDWVRN